MNPEEQKTGIASELNFVAPTVRRGHRSSGFTLIEILLSTTIFLTLMVVALSMFGKTSQIWQRSTDEAKAFQSARLAFDLLTRNLSQATLNTHMEYVDSGSNFVTSGSYNNMPVKYARQSDLQFFNNTAAANLTPGTYNTGQAVFFQFPGGYTTQTVASGSLAYAGMEQLMNACGYFIQYEDEAKFRPTSTRFKIVPVTKYRYRLMQALQRTEANLIYTSGTSNPPLWVTGTANSADKSAVPIADNVVFLMIKPFDPSQSGTLQLFTQSSYLYNSRPNGPDVATFDTVTGKQALTENQLPPAVQVIMIAIDEPSARRLDTGSATQHALFTDIQSNGVQISGSGAIYHVNKPLETAGFVAGVEALFQKPPTKYKIPPINYRIFSTVIPLRESKWTK